jgi:hypothetical protein
MWSSSSAAVSFRTTCAPGYLFTYLASSSESTGSSPTLWGTSRLEAWRQCLARHRHRISDDQRPHHYHFYRLLAERKDYITALELSSGSSVIHVNLRVDCICFLDNSGVGGNTNRLGWLIMDPWAATLACLLIVARDASESDGFAKPRSTIGGIVVDRKRVGTSVGTNRLCNRVG